MRLLRIELMASGRVSNALNHWAISSILTLCYAMKKRIHGHFFSNFLFLWAKGKDGLGLLTSLFSFLLEVQSRTRGMCGHDWLLFSWHLKYNFAHSICIISCDLKNILFVRDHHGFTSQWLRSLGPHYTKLLLRKAELVPVHTSQW